MSHFEDLKINTLFLALTRPAMTMGVTHEYFILNILFSMCVFIAFNNIFYAVVWVPVHIFGVLVHRFDNFIFKLLRAKASFTKPKSEKHWGVITYEPY